MLLISTFLLSTLQSTACGPYAPIIPTPSFFEISLSNYYYVAPDHEREENLRLWQSLTSSRIPLGDIEQAVYKDSKNTFDRYTDYDLPQTDNLFYIYLNNTNDYEIKALLSLAKSLEEQRRNMNSPWYYPRKNGEPKETGDFSNYISQCKRYQGKRLKDRYALQMTRALFASKQYAECAGYVDSVFAEFPDDNLMKRMAQVYAAGCWTRLGDSARANLIYAKAGDINSIRDTDPIQFMATHNPEAPQLMDFIRSNALDSAKMIKTKPIAQHILNDNRVNNKGDWYFLLSYISNEYENNPSLALSQIRIALNRKFSSSELHNLARAYRMKLSAGSDDSQSLLTELKWIESQTDAISVDAKEWIRRLQNIIYADWIPALWKQRDYTSAILLCAYADSFQPSNHWVYEKEFKNWRTVSTAELRDSEQYHNSIDYCSLSFQMMQSISSSQLISVYRNMMRSTPLNNFLRRRIRTDKDFYYELIGTLALREENFARAEQYLSQVGNHYIRTMNIDKDGYLARNPFCLNSYGHGGFLLSHSGGIWKTEVSDNSAYVPECGAKLDFARKMLKYSQMKLYGRTADDRGLARLMYAIGRFNSYNNCWALTQYWNGWVGLFEPYFQYWDDNVADGYGFLYNYDETEDFNTLMAAFDKEVDAAVESLSTDEARAKAQYVLGNLKTIVKRHPDTDMAGTIRTSCDNWSSWL